MFKKRKRANNEPLFELYRTGLEWTTLQLQKVVTEGLGMIEIEAMYFYVLRKMIVLKDQNVERVIYPPLIYRFDKKLQNSGYFEPHAVIDFSIERKMFYDNAVLEYYNNGFVDVPGILQLILPKAIQREKCEAAAEWIVQNNIIPDIFSEIEDNARTTISFY
jgi:hypothetical protein